jgi:hypothetical protein
VDQPSRFGGLFKNWWPFWLLFFSVAIPFSWNHFDPPAKVAELSGLVANIQRMSGRSMVPHGSLSKVWVKVENGAVVGFYVGPAHYRAGQSVQVVQYQRKLTKLVSWKLAS